MKPFLEQLLKMLFPFLRGIQQVWQYLSDRLFPRSRFLGLALVILGTFSAIALTTAIAQAQNNDPLKDLENQHIQQFTLPEAPKQAPVYKPKPAAPKRSSPPPSNKPASTSPPPAARRPAPSPQPRPQPQRAVATPSRRRPPTPSQSTIEAVEEQAPPPTSEYVLAFNRSPVVGDRFRLRGFYAESRLGFPRPRNWKMKSAKALIRFQHSPALLANRSNLTLMLNGASVASVPLNRPKSEIGNVLFAISPDRIRDHNQLSLIAQQHIASTCKEESPTDETLWTEVLPDSKLIFEYEPKAIPLDFNRYPYPFFDELSLDPTQIAYLKPAKVDDDWLTGAARFSANLGRLAQYRPIETHLVSNINQLEGNERLVIVGTPEKHPTLGSLELPFQIQNQQVLDGSLNPLPPDVGVLMITTTEDEGIPILVATGNGPEGVRKAVQFLVQSDDQKIGTGQGILVSNVTEEPTPSERDWPNYLPEKDSFKLSDLHGEGSDNPFEDITVRGSYSPPIVIDFRALPDDRFKRGSSMNLRYSYGPQVNPRTSALEVTLDDVFIGGARLNSKSGATQQTLNVNLPENLITPNSKLKIAFRMYPREPGDDCGRIVADEQLTGTIHADTSFHLQREHSVELPNLERLRYGYPFAAPQDLSRTAVVLPDTPSDTDISTLLTFSERLGRLSKAKSVQLNAYTRTTFPNSEQTKAHLVGIGTQEQFPFKEVFQNSQFKLNEVFSRQWKQSSIQTVADGEGVIQEVISPWNNERVLLALSSQTETGLDRVRQLMTKDPWFHQIQKDTVLVSANSANASAYDPDAYNLKFLDNSTKRRIENTSFLSKITRWLQDYWFMLPTLIVGFALILYGISQLYLRRVSEKKDSAQE
ncbi:MAG: cellulose biosynthesis cyclic di-GMP-binding regulatory protein BcsB [Chroococcales cyanobacterium]